MGTKLPDRCSSDIGVDRAYFHFKLCCRLGLGINRAAIKIRVPEQLLPSFSKTSAK